MTIHVECYHLGHDKYDNDIYVACTRLDQDFDDPADAIQYMDQIAGNHDCTTEVYVFHVVAD